MASLFPFMLRIRHDNPYSAILSFFLAFAPCYIILSISVEGLFYVAFSSTLVTWIEVETAIRGKTNCRSDGSYHFRPDDLRIALFFLFFVQVAFFGTGK